MAPKQAWVRAALILQTESNSRRAWYERLALLYHQYGHRVALDDEDAAKHAEQDDKHLHLAREVVLKGLEDPHTHLGTPLPQRGAHVERRQFGASRSKTA